VAAAATTLAAVALAACSTDGREMRPPQPDQTLSIATTTVPTAPSVSPSEPAANGGTRPQAFSLVGPFTDDAVIDAAYTCDGADVPPTFRWFGLPVGAVELALVMTDVTDGGRVRWAIAGIDPLLPVLDGANLPVGVVRFANADGVVGWQGPCPDGDGAHSYLFELHALGQQLELPTGTPAAEAMTAIDALTIAVATLSGRYPDGA
jgi:hypothetical protein